MKQEQENQARLYGIAEMQNIERLQKKVNDAKSELGEALLKRQNRIMGE